MGRIKQISPTKIKRQNILEGALRPIVTIGKCYGLIPLENTKSGFIHFIFRYALPILAIGMNMADSVWSYKNRIHINDDESKLDIIVDIGSKEIGKLSITVLILISLTKSKQMISCKKAFRAVDPFLEPFAKILRILGWTLAIVAVLTTILYDALTSYSLYQEYSENINLVWFSNRVVVCGLETFVIFSLPFIVIVIVKALIFGFQKITEDLEEALSENSLGDIRGVALQRLRLQYQTMTELADQISDLFNPGLIILLIVDVFHLCSYYYAIAQKLMKADWDGAIGAMLFFATFRLIVVVALCVLGGNLTDKSRSGLQHIYNAKLLNSSSEYKFQVRLLESKMTNYPATINASGFADLNRSLMIQIIGVVTTYVLVMVQFKSPLQDFPTIAT